MKACLFILLFFALEVSGDVSISVEGAHRYILSKDLPNSIKQPNTCFRTPLSPKEAVSPTSLQWSTFGVFLNEILLSPDYQLFREIDWHYFYESDKINLELDRVHSLINLGNSYPYQGVPRSLTSAIFPFLTRAFKGTPDPSFLNRNRRKS